MHRNSLQRLSYCSVTWSSVQPVAFNLQDQSLPSWELALLGATAPHRRLAGATKPVNDHLITV